MARSQRQFALDICRAVYEASKHKRPPYWISASQIMKAVKQEYENEFDAGVLYALERGWLQINGVPVRSLCIKWEGIKQIERRRAL